MKPIRAYPVYLIAAVALSGCISQDSPVEVHTPVEAPPMAAASPAAARLAPDARPGVPTSGAPAPLEAVRGSSEWRQIAWVGQRHTQIMNEIAGTRAEWQRETRVQQCRRVFNLVHRHALEIQREHRAFTGLDVRRLSLAAVRNQGGCDPGVSMSLWGGAGGTDALLTGDYVYHPDHGDPVTGAYESYVAAIEAVPTNHSTKSSMISAVNTIVASAAGIPDPDRQVVYAAADLALESIHFWYDYEASGGFGGGDRDPVLAMSIFRVVQSGKTISGGIAHDVIGCGSAAGTAKIAAAGGPIGWKILGAVCLVGGGAASAMYAI